MVLEVLSCYNDAMNSTLAYYAQNAQNFFDNTYDKEMHGIYEKFLPFIPENGYILDAGCGSGRDSLYFLSRHYKVNAFDASAEMAALAKTHIGQEVQCLTFNALSDIGIYDGIWAAASLLHLPYPELVPTFTHLAKALKADGIFYASFKYATEEYTKEGRHFTPLDEAMTQQLFVRVPSLQLQEVWLTDDQRQDRKGEKWLNLLAKKVVHDNS